MFYNIFLHFLSGYFLSRQQKPAQRPRGQIFKISHLCNA